MIHTLNRFGGFYTRYIYNLDQIHKLLGVSMLPVVTLLDFRRSTFDAARFMTSSWKRKKDKRASVLNDLLARAPCSTRTWCPKESTSESPMQSSRALVVTADTIVSLMSFWRLRTSFHTFHTCRLLASKRATVESSHSFTLSAALGRSTS